MRERERDVVFRQDRLTLSTTVGCSSHIKGEPGRTAPLIIADNNNIIVFFFFTFNVIIFLGLFYSIIVSLTVRFLNINSYAFFYSFYKTVSNCIINITSNIKTTG